MDARPLGSAAGPVLAPTAPASARPLRGKETDGRGLGKS